MIADIIIKAAGMEQEEDKPYKPRPSNAGPERCIRQMVYHAANAPKDNRRGDRFILTLDDSSWHEELTASWLGKTAFVLHSQQMPVDGDILPWRDPKPVRCDMCSEAASLKAGQDVEVTIPGNILHGHIDGIITDLMGSDLHYEHKALSFFTVEKYWNSGVFPLDYITQCCIYQKAIRKKLNPDITKTCLLIKNKNSAGYMDYVIEYDIEGDSARIMEMSKSSGEIIVAQNGPIYTMENVIGSAIERFRLVDEHVKAGTFPDRQYDMGDWQCDYCPWGKANGTCWAGYEKEMADLVQNAEFEGVITEEFIEPVFGKLKEGIGDVPKKYTGQQEAALHSVIGMPIDEVCRRYLEVSNENGITNAEVEALKYVIRTFVNAQGATKGRAGEYTIHDQVQKYSYLNREKIPASILQVATEQRIKRVLQIRKPKGA